LTRPVRRVQLLRVRVVAAPLSEAELLGRAEQLAGKTLAQVAGEFGQAVPETLHRAKGFVGLLLERALGATAKSKDQPDFEQLGIELKSLPVDERGSPLETTFVCTIALLDTENAEWEHSRLRRKLARVLWMPVLGVRSVAVAERRIGSPLLWSPSPDEDRALRWDWDELMGVMGRGHVDSITGHLGQVLQVRPKARNGSSRRRALDADGCRVQALPRGFYLRTAFTQNILRQHYLLPRATPAGP
jgi:DNA mismatch repair protein MutH